MSDEQNVCYQIVNEIKAHANYLQAQVYRINEIVNFMQENFDFLTIDEIYCLQSWLNHSSCLEVSTKEIIKKLGKRKNNEKN